MSGGRSCCGSPPGSVAVLDAPTTVPPMEPHPHADPSDDFVAVVRLVERALRPARAFDLDEASVAADALGSMETLLLHGDPYRWPGQTPERALLYELALGNLGTSCERWTRDAFAKVGLDFEGLLAEARDAVASPDMARFHNDPADYRWVPVSSLPYARRPKRQEELFDRMLRRSERLPVRPGAGRRADLVRARAGRWWQKRLVDGDLGHFPEFSDAVETVATLLDDPRFGRQWVEATIANKVPAQQRAAVRGLLFDPITWDETSRWVSNGQHRIAQARLAGIQRLPVVAE